MPEPPRRIDDFVHSVRSTCGILVNAAERMRKLPDAERRAVLALMIPRAQRFVDLLKQYSEDEAK